MTTWTDARRAPNGVIVVGVDFSPTSERAVTASFGLAHQNPGADIHLVHVVTSAGGSTGGRGSDVAALEEDLQRLAQHHFSEARIDHPRIFTHLLQGDVARELVQLATDVHADLIVVGTHGQSAGTSLTVGTVPNQVLHIAPCAVLAVKPKQLPFAPEIHPPCPACLALQRSSPLSDLWCERHRPEHRPSRAYYEEPSPRGRGAMSMDPDLSEAQHVAEK